MKIDWFEYVSSVIAAGIVGTVMLLVFDAPLWGSFIGFAGCFYAFRIESKVRRLLRRLDGE